MTWRIGVDIGGTFIDFCALDERSGALHTLKVLTTPADPGQEVMDGITLLQSRHGMDPADVTAFVHGTTVGINTVIRLRGRGGTGAAAHAGHAEPVLRPAGPAGAA
jgi:N-methylhydantoinase A